MEIWKDIENYEGLYQVSNLGRVKSLGNDKSKKEKILKPQNTNHGYFQVNLFIKGKGKLYLIHRLVAQAFIPNPDNLPYVNHKSEIKSQNYVWVNEDGTIDPEKSNLEWCDSSYNNNYGTHNERSKVSRSKPVVQMALDNTVVKIWPSANEATRYGFNQGNISACCNGKSKTYKGFKWQYA